MKSKPIYDPSEIEPRWQKYWEQHQTYKTPDKGQKEYVLGMFPYPSGDGLHVGHVRIYTGTDVLSRFLRMNGKKVLHPMGWDAFGLPTENAAIKAKINPKILAKRNIDNFRHQMQIIGLGFDWSREFATTDPEYYRWTQWLFLKMYSLKNSAGKRLIYREKVAINWCDSCKTVLANEEVLGDGTHERCGKPVTQRQTEQWLFRITDYADRLLADLTGLDWPRGIIEMQRNWIGKKEGINITYRLKGTKETLACFTTTPVNFGATFIVISPEHPFAQKIAAGELASQEREEVQGYITAASRKTEQQRKIDEKNKTGVFTGFYAINHVTNEEIPVWVSDFVLMTVGTGAVQGCPGHDQRDFEFAKKFGISIKRVVIGPDGDASPIDRAEQVIESGHQGKMVDSDFLNGMEFSAAMQKTMDYFEDKGWGKRVTTYHLRDWIFSRQHYWGEPIPLVYCDKCGDENGVVPIAENQLPVELPNVDHYEPTATGKSPLSQIGEWVNTKCPVCGNQAKRETDTMPNWAGSCWYFLRFADNKNSQEPFLKSAISEWLPVDWYLGGAEHAVLHLLYARFWVKALHDLGLLSIKEPFSRLRSVGMVLGEGHVKMSKSLGNVINPDEIVGMYGADTLRIYEMFMGPWDQAIAWSMQGVAGAYRFLERIYRIVFIKSGKIKNLSSAKLINHLNQLINKITADIPAIKFNTAIAAMMKFVNTWDEDGISLTKKDAGVFAQLLAPFAPHLADEIWMYLGNKSSVHQSNWPQLLSGSIEVEQVDFPIQINGKTRAVLSIDAKTAQVQAEIVKLANENPKIKQRLSGKQIIKQIFVPGKTLNFVI